MNIFTKIKYDIDRCFSTKVTNTGIYFVFLSLINALVLTSAIAKDNSEHSEMVLIKNHSLHMDSQGEGEFTVIFEAGMGSDLSHWRYVATAISKNARVIRYSRAGLGKSEAAPTTPSLLGSSEALSELIHQAQLQPPFILVGHSYGSHIVRTFAAQHPEDIAGLVLVEPANEQFMIRLKQIDKLQTEKFLDIYKKMVSEKLQAENDVLMAIDEQGYLPDYGPLPNVPAAILTSMVQEHPQFIIHSVKGKKVWRELHSNLFNQFNNAQHIVTMNSGHNIALQEPELVIDAINSVIHKAQVATQKQHLLDTAGNALKLITDNNYLAAEQHVFEFLRTSSLDAKQINKLGYQYLSGKNTEYPRIALATIVLKYNMLENQTSANAFDSYGEALLALNEPNKAKAQFIQAIKLVGSTNAQAAALKGYQANLAKAEQMINR